MSTEKLTFKEVLLRHWLLAGLYAIGTLIVLWITVNRIAEIPWRYYRYWQTVGVYLLVLGGVCRVRFPEFTAAAAIRLVAAAFSAVIPVFSRSAHFCRT